LSKEKFDEYTQISICGVLDVNNNGSRVVFVDGKEYDFEDIVQKLIGNVVEIKAQIK